MSELFHPEFEEEPPNHELMGPAKIEKGSTATLLSAFRKSNAYGRDAKNTWRVPNGLKKKEKKTENRKLKTYSQVVFSILTAWAELPFGTTRWHHLLQDRFFLLLCI